MSGIKNAAETSALARSLLHVILNISPWEFSMAKYGKKAASMVKKAIRKQKRGTLKSGQSGKKVTNRKQAIAIGLSEARKAGGKVPSKKK
jgi:hypothetical protein